jgi:manganese transport protein
MILLNSTLTGTLAGQIVMEGYLNLRITPWLRRLITRMIAVIPAFLIIWLKGEDNTGNLIILSQVILSLQLGFAVIPLIHFVSDKEKMGKFAISTWTKIGAWVSAAIIVSLNAKLVLNEISSLVESSGRYQWIVFVTVIPIVIGAGILLLYIVVQPLFVKRRYRLKGPHEEYLPLDFGLKDQFKKSIPLGRYGSPEEVAKAALFLASDLSSYINGQVISVCGGLNT